MAPNPWDAAADRDLLLCIIDTGDLKKLDWAMISARMQEKGHAVTLEACRQHFQKLRKQSGKARNPPSYTGPPAPVEKFPQKRARQPKGQKKKDFTEYHNEDDDEEEELYESPLKRQRSAVKQEKEEGGELGAYMFKMENDGIIDLENDDMYEA